MSIRVNIKPLSVNECWQGIRYKTPKYRAYEKELLLKLPTIKQIPEPPYMVIYEFGMNNMASDVDNQVKAFQDVLQKKYRFNDKDIMEMRAIKVKVDKGMEYIDFAIQTYIQSK